MVASSSVVLIGGRSGSGKTSVAAEMHHQLSHLDIRHCWIEGDYLDMAHPPTWEHELAERNLAAVWSNYRELGYTRLIYTNTASVVTSEALVAAMGDDPDVIGVLLTAADATVKDRLAGREIGTALDWHYERSIAAAGWLQRSAPSWVHRVPTDGAPVASIAKYILDLTGWSD